MEYDEVAFAAATERAALHNCCLKVSTTEFWPFVPTSADLNLKRYQQP
jgi:hypothetical protein